MQRRTCVLAPHISILYKRMSPKIKGQFSKLLAQVIRETSEKRWPDAELQGVQLHDDTQYLHMNLWSLKGKMVRHQPRGQKEKDVQKFSAAAIKHPSIPSMKEKLKNHTKKLLKYGQLP